METINQQSLRILNSLPRYKEPRDVYGNNTKAEMVAPEIVFPREEDFVGEGTFQIRVSPEIAHTVRTLLEGDSEVSMVVDGESRGTDAIFRIETSQEKAEELHIELLSYGERAEIKRVFANPA